MQKSFDGLDITDDPNGVQSVYGQNPILEGLGIINWHFCPHYRSDHPESESTEKEIAYYEKTNMPYKALKDGEVIISDTKAEIK
mgnify:CR=1 FL=1